MGFKFFVVDRIHFPYNFFFENLITSAHLLVRAVQYWLFAQGFNLVLLQKQVDHQEIQNYSIGYILE